MIRLHRVLALTLCLCFCGALVLAILYAYAPQAAATSGGGAPPQSSGTSVTVTVVGTVVDASLSPVPSAAVALERDGRVVASADADAQGGFRLTKVPVGNYTVRVRKAGFTPTVRELRVPAGTTTIRLPIVLMRPEDVARAAAPAADVRRVGGGGAPTAASAPPGPSAAPVESPQAAGRSGAMRSEQVNVAATPPAVAAQSGERSFTVLAQGYAVPVPQISESRERYASVEPGRFHRVADDPLSTFGADVDTASFANVRRFLQSGQLPPVDAVRVEEFVNYFRFAYPTPSSGHPIGLTTEVGDCPWAPSHKLVLIGARAVPSSTRHVEGRNIVLLIDVSGSMSSADKLPLVKSALSLFVDTLDADDRLAIVTYAGASGLALPSTPARDRQTILAAIGRLGAGGSTNGAQGITLAYRVARQAFIPGGVNRVILATDGDFNVGITDQQQLLRLIEREKASGVFLSVFGVGTGNLQDATMEMLADHGNGVYSYLDSLQEARRVLVTEVGATLETVAKEVKFQVEFNPRQVASWKLIGYENRVMAAEDFNDDRKDGGELGAGHSVTVLYEIVPVGVATGDDSAARPRVDPLTYQPTSVPGAATSRASGSTSTDWLTVKVRYQLPEGDESRLITQALSSDRAATRGYLPFASGVAEFGLLLRSPHVATAKWDALLRRLDGMSVPATLAADRDQVRELAALARGLARIE